MSTLNEVLSGLHETDKKLKDKVVDVYSKVGLSAIQEGTALLNSNNRIDPAYNSLKVASMEALSGQDQLQKIKFIGNCKVTFGADGIATIRIGDNLNSSNLGAKDGTTDGTAITATASGTKITGTPASDMNGVSHDIYKSVSYTIATDDFIHFDGVNEGEPLASGYLDIKVGKADNPSITTIDFGALQSGALPKTIDGVTLNFIAVEPEANISTGANGYQGKLQFDIPNSVLDELASNADVRFEIRLVSPSDECGGTYEIPNAFFKVDSESYNILPQISNTTISVTENEYRWNSGVKYISQGSVTINANVANLNNPAKVADAVDVIPDGNWFVKKTSTENNGIDKGGDDTSSAAATFQFTSNLTGMGYFNDPTATVKFKNAMGTTSETLHVGNALNIDISTDDDPTELVETFKDERFRVTSGGLEYPYLEPISGTNDLMVSYGKLIYPSATMFGVAGYSTSSQRYYYRHFCDTSVDEAHATRSGGTISFSDITENDFNSTLTTAEISIDNGASWLNLKLDRVNGNSTNIKTGYKVDGTTYTVEFAMPPLGQTEFNVRSGFILKLGWIDPDLKISQIAVTTK